MKRETIKYLACLTMTLNHFARIILEPTQIIYTIFLGIGYFTAPVMCFFLVEGYYNTHSKKKYMQRLAIFAFLSEYPFCLAFSQGSKEWNELDFCGLNMLFTLLLCFCILLIKDLSFSVILNRIAISILVVLSMFSDWKISAPVLVLLFDWADQKRDKVLFSFIVGAGVVCLVELTTGSGKGINIAFSTLGILGSGFVIAFLYNGMQKIKRKKWEKWFFYLYYPCHLLVFGLLRP